MKISKRQLRRIILEEIEVSEYSEEKDTTDLALDHEFASEVKPQENSWAGGQNVHNQVDHSKAGGSIPVTRGIETISNAPPVLNNESRIQVYRGKNDMGKSYKVPRIIFELYCDAWVNGNTSKARNVIEEHLDNRFPGWMDYEWRSA